jgi:hypothetical protein
MVSAGSEPEAIEARSGKVPPALPETFQTERQGFQHHPHQVYTIMEVEGGAFQSETLQSLLNKELPPTSSQGLAAWWWQKWQNKIAHPRKRLPAPALWSLIWQVISQLCFHWLTQEAIRKGDNNCRRRRIRHRTPCSWPKWDLNDKNQLSTPALSTTSSVRWDSTSVVNAGVGDAKWMRYKGRRRLNCHRACCAVVVKTWWHRKHQLFVTINFEQTCRPVPRPYDEDTMITWTRLSSRKQSPICTISCVVPQSLWHYNPLTLRYMTPQQNIQSLPS